MKTLVVEENRMIIDYFVFFLQRNRFAELESQIQQFIKTISFIFCST